MASEWQRPLTHYYMACFALLSLGLTPPPSDSALYEAYNQLHTHSQRVIGADIESPAVVVVGRQTDGKSALIEALMGFQFNHVGGGTKTRRPIALQMQYDPEFEEPACYLATGDGEQHMSLRELQAYIERENARLEAAKAFEAEEIIVRIRYKYCPNLVIIDTPGLLAASLGSESDTSERPNVDEKRDVSELRDVDTPLSVVTSRSFGNTRLRLRLPAAGKDAQFRAAGSGQQDQGDTAGSEVQERDGFEAAAVAGAGGIGADNGNWGSLQRRQAADVEALVLSKIRSREAIILCVEECNNWQLAPARTVVARADSALRRTVVVSSKLDTKFAQFGRLHYACCPQPK